MTHGSCSEAQPASRSLNSSSTQLPCGATHVGMSVHEAAGAASTRERAIGGGSHSVPGSVPGSKHGGSSFKARPSTPLGFTPRPVRPEQTVPVRQVPAALSLDAFDFALRAATEPRPVRPWQTRTGSLHAIAPVGLTEVREKPSPPKESAQLRISTRKFIEGEGIRLSGLENESSSSEDEGSGG